MVEVLRILGILVIGVWVLACVCTAISEDPNAGVMERWIDNEEFKR